VWQLLREVCEGGGEEKERGGERERIEERKRVEGDRRE
jgi:hypothetical protein